MSIAFLGSCGMLCRPRIAALEAASKLEHWVTRNCCLLEFQRCVKQSCGFVEGLESPEIMCVFAPEVSSVVQAFEAFALATKTHSHQNLYVHSGVKESRPAFVSG